MELKTKNQHINLKIYSLEESLSIDYESMFDSAKHLQIELEPNIIGNTIPIFTLKIPNDYKIMRSNKDDEWYAIRPNINNDGWSNIT